MIYALIATTALSLCTLASAQPVNLEFDSGVTGWRTVLDGVMGGRSSGRITQPETGVLRFSGELSLENNGGFSQVQTNVREGSFDGASGIEARFRGDGRTYQFDVRCADVRMMAGSFQTKFETVAGEWVTVRLPFDQFRLYSFGRLVSNAPALTPARVESIGVTLADKEPGAFQLDIDFVRALTDGDQSQPPVSSLPIVAKTAGLTTFLSLVQRAGLTLPADGQVTIFAPNNDAFAALPAETVQFLTSDEGRPALLAILRHHVLPVNFDSGTLLQRRGVSALSGQSLSIDGEKLTIGGAQLLKTDVTFDRGTVYVIDRIMMPETRSIADIVTQDPRLSTLLKSVSAAGLASQLSAENAGPWTLLAPSNEAFAALGDEAIRALLADPSQLASVLGGHVLTSRIRRSDMIAQGSARTLLGRDTVPFTLVDGQIAVAGSTIVSADIEAANGIIHIIDRVIVPSTPAPNQASMGERAAVTGFVELAIERGAPLFNNGQHAACAAIYEVTIAALIDLAPEAVSHADRESLRLALAEGEAEADAASRAWIFRRAMDRVYETATRSRLQ